MPRMFDQATLDKLDQTDEIEIETRRSDTAPAHRTTIWIVVDGGEVYVRSVRGPAGRWYRELVANPRGAVHADGSVVAVEAQAASDTATNGRVSAALQRKYERRWPGPTASMLTAEVVPTTLRLEPSSLAT
jgi:hypothetical protein